MHCCSFSLQTYTLWRVDDRRAQKTGALQPAWTLVGFSGSGSSYLEHPSPSWKTISGRELAERKTWWRWQIETLRMKPDGHQIVPTCPTISEGADWCLDNDFPWAINSQAPCFFPCTDKYSYLNCMLQCFSCGNAGGEKIKQWFPTLASHVTHTHIIPSHCNPQANCPLIQFLEMPSDPTGWGSIPLNCFLLSL